MTTRYVYYEKSTDIIFILDKPAGNVSHVETGRVSGLVKNAIIQDLIIKGLIVYLGDY